MTKPKNPLLALIDQAQRAMPYHARYTPGIEEPSLVPKKAAALRTLVLNKTSVRVDRSGQIIVGNAGNMAGETITIDKAIFKGSRFAQAGGTLVFLPEHAAPEDTGTAIAHQEVTGNAMVQAMRAEPVSFAVVNPAEFELVGDDDDAPAGTLPVFVADFSRADQKSYGVSFRLTRAQRLARGEQTTADELLASVVAGLSKVVDRLALQAILATTPTSFSLSAAAAAGVRFAELKAMVGSDATAAAILDDGRLTAHGITAELTDVMTETVIGDFSKAAAVIGPDLQILVSRLNKNGDVSVTAWLSVDALCPAAGKFWLGAGTVEEGTVEEGTVEEGTGEEGT